jgi:beta-galactosidase
MFMFHSPPLSLLTLGFAMTGLSVQAAPLTVTVQAPPAPSADGFRMGTAVAPDGTTLTLDNRSLLLNGRRWTPAMGEFHYSRYPAAEWRDELRKMKAGGIDILATYVFWNHHEEIEGGWDWSGDRDLRRFITMAGEVGLKVIVRCGPWCHGEVRNGGIPDWALEKGWKVRTDDPPYLDHIKLIYAQIAKQTVGLLWKDGGPVIGIQLENEYNGPAEHLLHLKQIARDAGLDVPLYTRTGWPELKTPMPFGEIVPLYGVYGEGFWDRETTAMPGNYWAGFHFSTLRTDANIANEALGRRDAEDSPDVSRYPYLTCEIGGGMMSSYHRRILVDPRDIEATVLVKIGSGSVSPGYYMYHGGTNPVGRTTLMEEQGTEITNWNDMPVKNYDFQAPLGQYGQVRPHYRVLRRVHHFMHDFGASLADMATCLPDQRPAGKDDTATLRWAARSDGRSGFIFVNNYERLKPLPAKERVQFAVKLATGDTVLFPLSPVTVPADACFIWAFNLDLGRGVMLDWATAQPLAVAEADGARTIYFAETPGVAPVFAFAATPPQKLVPGRELFKTMSGTGGDVRVVVLNQADSLAFTKDAATGVVAFEPPAPEVAPQSVAVELVRSAGPARAIPLGKIRQPVAVAPSDEDFQHAAVWRLKLPAGVDPAASDLILRVHYTGDVARFFIGGKLVVDDFYNGLPLEIGLRRHAADLKDGELTLAILPLRQDAINGTKPLIYLSSDAARPDFAGEPDIVRLDRVELMPRETIQP